ncbi:MAG: hypothetical protein ACTJGM_06200 [Fusobacterium sp.]
MKKLTLLLAAVTIASAAYAKEVMPVAEVAAAPMLTVTSIGQSIEIDNDSANGKENPNGNVGRVMFGNSINLAYGDDWTFGLFARKEWDTDTDDGFGDTGSRINLDAWRSYENTKLGFRFRMADSYDRYYIRGKYSYGMYSGWADLAYTAAEKNADYFYLESMPVKVTVGPVTVGYYVEATETVGSVAVLEKEDYSKHQVRLSAPIYSTEKLNLTAEYRYQFYNDKNYKGTSWNDENNAHIVILGADYAINENLTIDGYYEYDFNKYEESDDDFYGEFYVGWTYKF